MKRFYSLFFVMLLCLVGTSALAGTQNYNVIFSGVESSWNKGQDYGYIIRTVYSRSQQGVSSAADAETLVMERRNGTPTALTTSNIATYITPRAHTGYNVSMTVSGTTITIAYAAKPAFDVVCTTAGGGVEYNGKTYTNGTGVPAGATLADCKVASVAGYAGKLAQNGSTLTVSYIPVGRVFIKSLATPMYNQSSNQDADTDMYLTSLSNVMGQAWGATNYWSVWDITFDDATSTVTIVNEGNRDIMTPMQRYKTGVSRDAGYLHYNISENVNTGYGVGNCDDPAKRNIVWDVNANGQFTFRAQAAASTNYMYFDAAWGNGSNEGGVGNTGDHVAKSGNITGSNRNLWTIIPVTAADEAAMFARNVQELNGYVGGVVTLTNVEMVEKLQSINDNTEATCETIENGAQDGAKKMRDILDIMAGANEFGQELVNGRPFFLENMSSYRPQLYSRLTYQSSGNAWRTAKRATVDMDTPNGVFYVDKNSDGNYVAWVEDGNTKRYISGNSGVPTAGTSLSGALQFDIDPVIPGIWLIRDKKVTEASDTQKTKRYLTITQQSGTFYVTHYEVIEPSTLWKFKTYTTFDYTLQADPEGEISYCTGYTTYGQYMDSKLPADQGVKAWLASELKWDKNEMQITLREALHNQDEMKSDVYWLKAGYGYLITKPGVAKDEAGVVNDDQLARFIPDADYKAGNVHFSEDLAGVNNFFRPIPNDGIVSEEDWKNWFYLTYVKTGTVYTHHDGQPVNGFGVGFYRLQPGKTFKRGKARIAWEDSFGDEKKFVPKGQWNTQGAKGQMLFLDSEGETTDIITIGADGSLYREVNTYFDMSGRRVAQPVKGGVYIKNGKKVLY